MSGIRGKVVVITGGSSGIGAAAARLLAERGAKLVLGARGLNRLEALAVQITDAGGEIACIRADVGRSMKNRPNSGAICSKALCQYSN